MVWLVQLLEQGRQAARHVKNARQAAQQVESMGAKEQREKLKPSALAALEGREKELKVRLSPTAPRRSEHHCESVLHVQAQDAVAAQELQASTSSASAAPACPIGSEGTLLRHA